ncbi:MAG: hypothetical protein H0U75_12560 [Legionella sp.]|nr:hypothetical protein [Legionella sp.]
MDFQNINLAIEQVDVDPKKVEALQNHPLLDLNKKTTKVEDIRKAIAS